MKARYTGFLFFVFIMAIVILASLSFSEPSETDEMDHENMPGMEEASNPTAMPSQDMADMDHSNMPGMNHDPQSTMEAVYRTLTIEEFAGILESWSDQYTVINVHIPYEGEVEGTDAHIPYNDLDALTAALPDKNAPIILYCRSGNMSEQASRQLVEMGYTQLWDVPGGMNAWQTNGRELMTPSQ